MKRGMARFIGCLGVILLFAAHATQAQQGRVQTKPEPAKSLATADGEREEYPAAAQRNPRYKIGRSDVLSIAFPLSPELNQTVTVQPDGFISLYDAGELRIEGLTSPEVVEAVRKAYAGTLNDPIINVDLVDFQKPFFMVTGQVGKPGQYDLRSDITVSQAIAVAGGLQSTAKTQVFLYRAVSSNWAEVRQLKLKDILNGKNINEDVHLQPGDMIFVPESAITKFRKYVPYGLAVTSPYATF
jgi:polysaccharide export outer membrane protein